MKKETYKIQGMHCASCVATIERVLGKTVGVHSASVSFASESALIEFDENTITESGIEKTVELVGYHLVINKTNSHKKEEIVKMPDMDMNSPQHNHMEMERESQMKEMRLKLIIGGILAFFIFLGSFPEWFSFVPNFLNNYFEYAY